MGQDHARARIEGRHRLLREGRSHRRPRGPRLLHRRLRLHHLHRQHRPADRRGLGRGQRQRPRRHRGALGQPQLRGPHQPRREDELPREPAARHRLRPRRVDELRLRDRRARHRTATATTSSSRTSGPTPPRCRRRSTPRSTTEMFTHEYASVFDGDERWRSLPTPDSEIVRVGREVDLRAQAPVLRRHDASRPARSPTSPARACSRSSATRSPPTTSARPARSRPTARPARTCSSTASTARTSTPTDRVAATTR